MSALGTVAVSVTRYPVTATLSVAVNVVMSTVNDVDVAGMVKLVTTGGSVSTGTVMSTVALRELDTLPAASFAQAYSVWEPADVKVYVAGGVTVHPAAEARGCPAVSVTR